MSTKNNGPLVIGGEPRIDFLPQEVKQKKLDKRSRRSLITLVLLVVAVCIAGYAFSAVNALQAQVQLDAARERTQSLLSEQTKYGEASSADTELKTAQAAALVGSATEVLWRKYLISLQGEMPRGSFITKFVVASQSALETTPDISVPLENDRVATITFGVASPSLSSAEALLKNLEDLVGFADAAIVSAELNDTLPYYDVTVVLHVNSDVFERRLFLLDLEGNPKPIEEAPEEEDPTDSATGTPIPTGTPTETED